MMHVGDIMSTVEGVQYRGGNLLLFEYPTVLNIPHGTHDIPHIYHDIPPRCSNFKGWYPPTVLHTHYTGWLSAAFSCNFIFKLLNKTFSKLKTKRNVLMNTVSKKSF